MLAILLKEIGNFFSSLTGYIVIIVYLVINSLVMWVLPGDWNILDSGYAGLDSLFAISPWVFLFLVPAVTMRAFADEKRSGTLELLLSRPLTERQIIYGKWLASVLLVFLALLPTIVYYYTVSTLGETAGNLDKGGTLGALIGLFFLASVYGAIGIFASSLTDNQVIAFIIAVLISFLVFIGFDALSTMNALGKIDSLVRELGINLHYKSMSRGVIDFSDMVYFVSVIVVFTEATRLKLVSRSWRVNK